MTTNDLELAALEREINALVVGRGNDEQGLSNVIRNKTIDAVLTRAAKIEDAARKLGWRALALRNQK